MTWTTSQMSQGVGPRRNICTRASPGYRRSQEQSSNRQSLAGQSNGVSPRMFASPCRPSRQTRPRPSGWSGSTGWAGWPVQGERVDLSVHGGHLRPQNESKRFMPSEQRCSRPTRRQNPTRNGATSTGDPLCGCAAVGGLITSLSWLTTQFLASLHPSHHCKEKVLSGPSPCCCLHPWRPDTRLKHDAASLPPALPEIDHNICIFPRPPHLLLGDSPRSCLKDPRRRQKPLESPSSGPHTAPKAASPSIKLAF